MGEYGEWSSTARASWWSLTINNPTELDRQTIQNPPPRWLKWIKGQDEIGENGTLHLQFFMNTDQLRGKSIKDMFPRAHIKLATTALHISNLKNYIWKDETAVEGTRFERKFRAESEALTMAQVMYKIAENAYDSAEYQRLLKEVCPLSSKRVRTMKELNEAEFWDAVNILLAENENLVGLLTQPQYMRAWMHTRKVWVSKVELDRQTNITIYANNPDSPSIAINA